jgi:nucleoside-diphosphate-sugar epimerase
MFDSKQTVLVTGISGNLGSRLLPQLAGYNVVGVDLTRPATDARLTFEEMDLARESSCRQMVHLLRNCHANAVVHLAFVIDPVRTGVLQTDRMWQINVAGTARVMEAIAEVNRNHGGQVQKFIFPSSVSTYGSDLAAPATETSPLKAHTLPYAVHKREADEVVQYRASSLGACSTYILRPHIYAGATVHNYLIGALRGTPTGRGSVLRGAWRTCGWRSDRK